MAHIMELVERHVKHVDYASEYGEPGYDNPKSGILFADWNDCPKWLLNGLERRGYDLEWSDEWLISYETDKAYRSSPNCYGWKPYYVLTEGGDVIGGDEIENGSEQEWYVNEYLLNDPNHANVFNIDLTKYGFEQYNGTFENGFHPGQNDDPRKITKTIRALHPDCDIVFSIADIGQFDIHFTAWIRHQSS